MVTDPIFYRLFATCPETFFLLLGMSAEEAREMAARYQYQAIEIKETAHRTDGLFLPREPGLPLYFLEVQFYSLPSVFADLLAKVYTYLKRHDPGQPFRSVVLFGSRSLEPPALTPYQPLLDAGLIQRFYLDELPELADAPLSLAILYLIRQTDAQAATTARDLIHRVQTEIADAALSADLVEFIETVIIYKLPRLSRDEVQAMLQVHDIRQTRVYQEARAEGLIEGKQEGLIEGKQEGLKEAIARMAAKKMSAEEIAGILELDLTMVRQALNSVNGLRHG